jgi:pectate lyase C
MKKGSLIGLAVLCVVALSVWFSCNPFTTTKTDTTSYDVLDQTGGARLTITCTININGASWNGGGVGITCSGMGDGSQNESQDPVFNITNGSVSNCTINPPACDGMHFMGGSCSISSVTVPDIGEDIVSVKKPGTYTVSNCTFNQGSDKCFQINDLCTITENSVSVNTIGKFMRENGGKTWKMVSYCNNCNVQNASEAIFRSDASVSTFYYHNLTTNCGTIAYDSNTHAVAN